MAQYHADTHLDKVKKTRDREHSILGLSRPIARIVLSPAWPLANDVDESKLVSGGREKQTLEVSYCLLYSNGYGGMNVAEGAIVYEVVAYNAEHIAGFDVGTLQELDVSIYCKPRNGKCRKLVPQ